MKHILWLCLLLLLNSNLKAQQDTAWAPLGATWVYDELNMTDWSALKLVSIKDTLINNTLTKQIQLSRLRSVYPPYTDTTESVIGYEYMYESNDTVYWWVNNNFEPLYIFSAQPNDKWQIHKFPTATYTCNPSIVSDSVIVQNVSFQDYNGVQLKKIDLESIGKQWELKTLLSGIGAYSSPFPTMSFDSCQVIDGAVGSVNGLRCYYDPIRGHINFGDSNVDCAALLSVNTAPIQPQLKMEEILVFPNPTNDVLFFDAVNMDQKTIFITNMLGQVVLQKHNFQNNKLNVAALESGTYVITFIDKKGNTVYAKFIKL